MRSILIKEHFLTPSSCCEERPISRNLFISFIKILLMYLFLFNKRALINFIKITQTL